MGVGGMVLILSTRSGMAGECSGGTEVLSPVTSAQEPLVPGC